MKKILNKSFLTITIAVLITTTAISFYYFSFSKTFYRGMDEAFNNHKPFVVKDITNFDWDAMYVFGPLTSNENIQYISNSNYAGFPLLDDDFLLIFVKKGKAVNYIKYGRNQGGNISIANKSLLTQLVVSVCVEYHFFTPQSAIFYVTKLGSNHYSIIQK